MSFSYDVKSELCGIMPEKPCCKKALLYGMMLFGRNFSESEITIQTEHPMEIALASHLLEQLLAIRPTIRSAGHVQGRETFIFSLKKKPEIAAVFGFFGYDGKMVSLRINRADIENDCCTSAFVRGTFLACGSIVEPQKDYHIEFASPHFYLSSDLSALLKEQGLDPKLVNRRGSYANYIKDSAQIEDILTLMGAADKSLELMNIKIYKDFRNKANRVTNCETANIEKTVAASFQQISAIRRIRKTAEYEMLSPDLIQVAELRLNNPEMTLSEMGAVLKMSRSGVNHRLGRIVRLAERLHGVPPDGPENSGLK